MANNLNNDNVRTLTTKGAVIAATCNARTELLTVARVTKYQDGRTRVFVLDSYGSGRTLAFPMAADNVNTYEVLPVVQLDRLRMSCEDLAKYSGD